VNRRVKPIITVASQVTDPTTAVSAAAAPPPRRRRHAEVRSREHLLPGEVEQVVEAARKRGGRYGHRDHTLLLLMHRHGLRAAEIAALRWDQVDLPGGTLHVTRVKQGTPTTHPLRGPELRALRRLQREQPEHGGYVFVTERGGPMAGRTVHHIVAEAGRAAQLAFPIHPHMLRHATGYSLARQGTDTRALQAYLGHRDIRHTVRYTDLAPARFKEFWKD
jgi:integrase